MSTLNVFSLLQFLESFWRTTRAVVLFHFQGCAMFVVLLKTVLRPWYKNELQQYQYNVRKNTKNYSDFVLNFFRASSTIFKVDRGHQWKSNKLLSVLVWCCCKSTLNSKSVAQNWHLTRLPWNLLNYCTFSKNIQQIKRGSKRVMN